MKKILLLLTIALTSFFAKSQCELVVIDTTFFSEKACDSYTTPNNVVITSSQTISEDYINIDGCVVEHRTIEVLIITGLTYTISPVVCDTYTSVNNNVYTAGGMYPELEAGVAGCLTDVNLVIDLTVNSQTTNTISESVCDMYVASSGDTFNTDGVHTFTLLNSIGCDSVVTLNLTLLRTTNTINETACDMYVASSGDTFSTAGIHTFILPNSVGCDSIITVNLTLNSTTSMIDVTSLCQSYTAPDDSVYTVSGVYTAVIPNSVGCDSTITINLTLTSPTTSSINISSCVTYTAPDGQIYTSSGLKTAVITNAAGCDSTMSINLTINGPTTSNTSVTRCSTYTAPDGMVYTTSGVKTAVIPNSKGCDSTMTINLTINPLPSIATTIGENNLSIMAVDSNMIYQWFDCADDAAISSATNRIIHPLSGSYRVTITNPMTSCAATSFCVDLVNTANLSNEATAITFNVYPNPSEGKLIVTTSFTENTVMSILNVEGKLILIQTLNGLENEINVQGFDSGLYFINLSNANGNSTKQFVKK